MIEVLSVDNMRRSDAATIAGGISGRELMMRAGKAIFENVDWKPPVAIVCGTGNNAGDGYVLAKLLHDKGIGCKIFLLEEKFSEDGKYYYDICRESGVESEVWDKAIIRENCSGQNEDRSPDGKTQGEDGLFESGGFSTMVDCIFGTGFTGAVRGKAAEVIDTINRSGTYVVSVDINSGLNGDSGMAETCVISDLTISIGSFKPGYFPNMAKDVIRRKINCDIGITPVEKPFYLLENADIAPHFTPRPNYCNKGTFGYVALIGGSKRYSGAIRLASMANAAVREGTGEAQENTGVTELSAMANAAMRSGAGVVKVAVPDSLCGIVAGNILESTVFPLSDDNGEARFVESEIAELISNVKTVAFGMGIGVTDETAKILDHLLDNYTGKLIIDADGLTLLSKMGTEKILNSKAQLVLTPHIKEFSRLLGDKDISEILSTPIEYARNYAAAHNVILLLKGPSTIITDGNATYITDAGCAGMATAGSGDVLSGILVAVCAYLPEVADTTFAVAAGAYINGKAGELAQEKTSSISMVAGDTVSCIAEVISKFEGGRHGP